MHIRERSAITFADWLCDADVLIETNRFPFSTMNKIIERAMSAIDRAYLVDPVVLVDK